MWGKKTFKINVGEKKSILKKLWKTKKKGDLKKIARKQEKIAGNKKNGGKLKKSV
jgi:hypothetical protein